MSRKAMLAAIKEQMRAAGELPPLATDEDGEKVQPPKSAKDAMKQAMRDAFIGDDGKGGREFESKETADERYARYREEWTVRLEKRRAKRNFHKMEKARTQRAINSDPDRQDSNGVSYAEIEPGTPCIIIPKKFISHGSKNIEEAVIGVGRWENGTVVTAFFDDKSRHGVGNRDVRCLMPDGSEMAIPKTRLDILFEDELSEDDMDDLFEDE